MLRRSSARPASFLGSSNTARGGESSEAHPPPSPVACAYWVILNFVYWSANEPVAVVRVAHLVRRERSRRLMRESERSGSWGGARRMYADGKVRAKDEEPNKHEHDVNVVHVGFARGRVSVTRPDRDLRYTVRQILVCIPRSLCLRVQVLRSTSIRAFAILQSLRNPKLPDLHKGDSCRGGTNLRRLLAARRQESCISDKRHCISHIPQENTFIRDT